MANPNPNANQIVQAVRAVHSDLVGIQQPDGTWVCNPDKNIPFLKDLCAQLNDTSGMLRKDGGENIVWYEQAQCNVSISRVCYPDGTLAKVLSDAGPSPDSTNGPTFNYPEDTVDKSLYIQVVPSNGNGSGGGDNTDTAIILTAIGDLTTIVKAQSLQIAALQNEVTANQAALLDHMNRQTYSDTIFGNIKLVLHPDPVQ